MKRLLVVAGAAKAGTTTMVDALDSIAGFCAGTVKEPRYFYGRDAAVFGPLSERFQRTRLSTWPEYTNNFGRINGDIPIDGSTDYLNDPTSADRIRATIDDVRVIIGLRHPVARAFSEHQHLVRNGAEDVDFLSALHLEEQRRSDGWVPLFGHVERSLLAPGVAAFLEAFGSERVLIYRFEDMVREPATVADRICEFLSLDHGPDLSMTSNRSGRPRSPLLNAAVRSDKMLLRRSRHLMANVAPPRTGARIRDAVDRLNLDGSGRPTGEAVDWILDRTRGDCLHLENLTGLDLSAYRRSPST